MYSPTRFRSCRLERLEDRCLLSLTVITHGKANNDFPPWAYDLATAVAQRVGEVRVGLLDTDMDGIIDVPDAIENAKYDLEGNRQHVGDGRMSHNVMLFDWVRLSDNLGSANEDDVAGALKDIIHTRLVNVSVSHPLDIHFVGFSRGCYVNMEAIRRLAQDELVNRIGFLQMTTLDCQAYGADGDLEFNPGGIVDFSDNYYQRATGIRDVEGITIDGALNFDLTDVVRAWGGRNQENSDSQGNHGEVHDWYYGTIDPTAVKGFDVPTLDRSILYDNETLRFNLDRVSGPDDLGNGAYIGYYFSLTGGGIGTMIQTAYYDLYTFDLATGRIPLYLGHVNWATWDIAYSPQGELFAIDTNATRHDHTALYKLQPHFYSYNSATPLITLVGNLGVEASALSFSPDGRLFAAGGNQVYELNSSTGFATPMLTLPEHMDIGTDLVVDSHDTAYVMDVSGVLLAINTRGASWQHTPWSGLANTQGLVYRNHTLYGFREDGDYYDVDMIDGRVQYHGLLQPVNAPSVAGAAATMEAVRFPWCNPINRYDVNDDGVISGRDALNIINRINSWGSGLLPPVMYGGDFFYDIDCDRRITARDALQIINRINARASQVTSLTTLTLLPEETEHDAEEKNSIAVPQTAERALDAIMYLYGQSSVDESVSIKKRRKMI